MPMTGANLHVYPSNFTHETRILKETKSLADGRRFAPIYVGALWEEGLAEQERLDDVREVRRIKLAGRRLPPGFVWKIARFVEWSLRVYWTFRDKNIVCVNCHSFATLPVGILFRLFRGARLVYDTHELETETGAGRAQKALAQLMERLFMRYVDTVIVVSDSIGAWYRQRYGRTDVHVVRNIPYRARIPALRTTVLRDRFGIGDGDILFIYQGALDEERNVGLLLKVFARSAPDRHIVFLGYGSLAEEVRRYAREHANIHFHPPVRPEEVLQYTASADVGIHVIANSCLNHYYCLPNKIFEYLLSGLPAIISDFPEMARIVNETGFGWTTPVDEEAILGLVNRISAGDVRAKREKALAGRDRYGWETEEQKLLAAYGPAPARP